MTDWFRSWHGAPTDPKWLAIGKRAGVPAVIVSAIVWALLDHASQAVERGDVSGFDAETYAAFGGLDEEQVRSVLQALADKGVIEGGRLAAWDRRQPKREDDSSTERVREWRKRNEMQRGDTDPADVKRNETQRNATKRPREDTDTEVDKGSLREPRARDPSPDLDAEFEDQFWPAYPNKVGKPDALAAFRRARRGQAPRGGPDRPAADLATILAGLRRYVAEKPPDRQWLNPATFLNQGRWADEPADAVRESHGNRPRPLSNHDQALAGLRAAVDRSEGVGEARRAGHAPAWDGPDRGGEIIPPPPRIAAAGDAFSRVRS